MSRYLYLIVIFLLIPLFSVSIQASTYTVTKITDTNDAVCDSDCSLREAINAANNAPTNDTIEFAVNVFNTNQKIELSEVLAIKKAGELIINGPEFNKLTISGNRTTRIFL